MKNRSESGAFGPGFLPGKVKAARDSISHALSRRWSGRPAKTPAEGAETSSIEQEKQQTVETEETEE